MTCLFPLPWSSHASLPHRLCRFPIDQPRRPRRHPSLHLHHHRFRSLVDSSDLTSFSLNGITNFSGVVPDADFNAKFNNFDFRLDSPTLAGLSLASALGPVTGTSTNGTSVIEYFNTQTGRLSLTGEGAQSTFQVTDLSAPTSVTPEPSSLLLLATGLSGLAMAGSRRVKQAVSSRALSAS